MNYDFSAFSGQWPYRLLRGSGVTDMLAEHRQLGISGGCMSSLNAIFYNDPWEADGPLLKALSGTGWELAMCVNPMLPWAEQSVRGARSLGVRHIRLYPGIHHYALDAASGVCRLAEQLQMTVMIVGRMEDPRLCYLLDQQSVRAADCFTVARQHPMARFLLVGFYGSELSACGATPGNLWTDTSGLCHGLYPVQTLTEAGFPPDRILFGSLSPLQCLHSHLLNLPERDKTDILSGNAERFLRENYDGLGKTPSTL